MLCFASLWMERVSDLFRNLPCDSFQPNKGLALPTIYAWQFYLWFYTFLVGHNYVGMGQLRTKNPFIWIILEEKFIIWIFIFSNISLIPRQQIPKVGGCSFIPRRLKPREKRSELRWTRSAGTSQIASIKITLRWHWIPKVFTRKSPHMYFYWTISKWLLAMSDFETINHFQLSPKSFDFNSIENFKKLLKKNFH